MKLRTYAILLLTILIAGLVLASAEEKFGVKVYDGAKFDADTSTVVAKMAGEAACYRTPDGVAQVNAFYSKLPGVKVVSSRDSGGMFKIGGVDITVQRPWRDMKTGKMNQDTLISIVKPKK